MRELYWGYHQARIWLGEMPDWSYKPASLFIQHLEAAEMKLAGERSAAVEFLRPIGPMSLYGGLAATFAPEISGRLTIKIPFSVVDGPLWNSSLAARIDEVHRGLPEEFVEGIVEGLIDAQNDEILGMGMLQITGAVHGAIMLF